MTRDLQRQLINQALRGDRVALERLIEAHRSAVSALAFQALGNADDANDVAQEALVYAAMQLPALRDHDRFGAWIRQLTLTQCTNYRRNRRTRRLGEPLKNTFESTAEADFADRLTVMQTVKHLNESLRTTLLMHYLGGWSTRQISALLEIPHNTVRSRLMTAKRHIRAELIDPSLKTQYMNTKTNRLSSEQSLLLASAFPGARILTVDPSPEPWQPFAPRVKFALPGGEERTIDFRDNFDSHKLNLAATLEKLGIPGPKLVFGPLAGGKLCLFELPRGENLTLWALGGTPHRIRLATERAIEGIDRLQGCTEGLKNDPVGASLERRTLQDEIEILTNDDRWNANPWLAEEGKDRRQWLSDPWFAQGLAKVKSAVRDIETPLVYTDYTFFFPQGYRVQTSTRDFNEPLGWPGDPHYQENAIVEFENLFGHYGDPILGLTMVWIYDCYPFVHTGFVEQVLWRRGISRREFAPRLALKALQMVARDLPIERPKEGRSFWDSLHNWAEQGLAWM